MTDFDEMQRRALEISKAYAALEKEKAGRPWTISERTLGLVGDVGQLAKLVMAFENLRELPDEDVQAALRHELADVQWSLIVIAHACGVDIGQEFMSMMDSLDQRIAREAEK